MVNRSLQLLLAGCLMTGTLWAAENSFIGKWKVNLAKSKLNDEMKVEAAGANRYAITFGPVQVDAVVADGSDQPALSGTTLSENRRNLNDAFVRYLTSTGLKAQAFYANLQLSGKELLYRSSLNELAHRLDPARFIRVHRSCIVNIDSILELQPISHGEFNLF